MHQPNPGSGHRMLCTPPLRCRALQADVVHRVEPPVRASGAVARTGCGPLRTMSSTPEPVLRTAVRVGARTAGAARVRDAAAKRSRIEPSSSITQPLVRRLDQPAKVRQVTQNRRAERFGRAHQAWPDGAHRLGQTCAGAAHRGCGARARGHRCAHHHLPRAHHGAAAGRRGGTAAGSARHRRCARWRASSSPVRVHGGLHPPTGTSPIRPSAVGWGPPCSLTSGGVGVAARPATGWAGRRGSAASGDGPAAASVTGTAPRAAPCAAGTRR